MNPWLNHERVLITVPHSFYALEHVANPNTPHHTTFYLYLIAVL